MPKDNKARQAQMGVKVNRAQMGLLVAREIQGKEEFMEKLVKLVLRVYKEKQALRAQLVQKENVVLVA